MILYMPREELGAFTRVVKKRTDKVRGCMGVGTWGTYQGVSQIRARQSLNAPQRVIERPARFVSRSRCEVSC